MTRKKTWISIIIAAVIVVCMLAAAVVGGTIFFIYRHVHSEFTNTSSAEREFTSARERFAGQQALIELRSGDEPVLHRELTKGTRNEKDLQALRVLAYDDRSGKLVRVSIPFWLMRMIPSRNLKFLNDEGIDIDSDRVRLTLEDLERRGPGLVLDHKDRRGSQVLIWTE